MIPIDVLTAEAESNATRPAVRPPTPVVIDRGS